MTLLSSLRIIPGMRVKYEGAQYQVLDVINMQEVIIESADGHKRSMNASLLTSDLSSQDEIDILSITDSQWARAIEIFNIIRPLVDLGKSKRKRSDVEKVAESSDKHISTIYRWLSEYESKGLLSALIRKKRKDSGIKRLEPEIEKVIQETIDSYYLTGQKRKISKTVKEIEKICFECNLIAPDKSTVRKRIYEISEEYRVRRREGAKTADERFEPIQGKFPNAEFPLAVVQIDHTPMDVIVVDDIHREPIGRPFLTTAIDVFSKVLTGFYISLDSPGALATGMTISRSILGKEIFLAKLGIDNFEWPCWGIMRTVHTDNAKEFKGTLLGKAAYQYGIIVERRPKGRPKYGGHVERAYRTFMQEVHNELPGTTFSNIREKVDYDSEGKAVMTLDALERWFTLFILGVYHQNGHGGNDGVPPIRKLEQGIIGTDETPGTGIPMRAQDEEKLEYDFMPYFEPTVQEYGIRFKNISYYTDALRKYIHAKKPNSSNKKQTFICRYDPRDLSKLWFFDSVADHYIEVPYREISRPAISLWELRAAQKKLKEQSLSLTNEELIFKTIDQMREIVDVESEKTKKARRLRQRRKQWESKSKKNKKIEQKKIKEVPATKELVDEDLEEFEPFEGIREP